VITIPRLLSSSSSSSSFLYIIYINFIYTATAHSHTGNNFTPQKYRLHYDHGRHAIIISQFFSSYISYANIIILQYRAVCACTRSDVIIIYVYIMYSIILYRYAFCFIIFFFLVARRRTISDQQTHTRGGPGNRHTHGRPPDQATHTHTVDRQTRQHTHTRSYTKRILCVIYLYK